MSSTTRIRRTAFGLATFAVAATAITIPLIAQPAPAQAAAGGCTAAPTTLLIAKNDPDGRPLADATFQVNAQHWQVNSPLSKNFDQNPLYDDYASASAVSDQARQAADDARAALHAAQAAQAAAQESLTDLLDQAGAQSPKLATLYAQETAQSVALSAAQEALAQAQEHLTAAEWGGDSVEIAAAQEAVETATQAVADAETALVEIRAEIDELIAARPGAEEITEARAELANATAAVEEAAAEYDAADQAATSAARASEKIMIDAYEQVTTADTVTTDEEGLATVEVVGYASCTDGATGAQDVARIAAPVVTEIKAPAGFQLDSTQHTAEQLVDGSWTVTVVNEPEDPVDPEKPAEPVEPPTPLIQTGSDLTAPLTFGALLAVAGGVLASGPLLRHIRRRSA
ncbi:hypothetical protein [Leucobacter aridicollis]